MMRNLAIFIFILFNTLVATAQLKLNGTIGPIASVGYNRYTHVNWEISYKFEKRNNDIYLIYYNPRVTIPAHASYATPEKIYSKVDLGVSAWPQSNPPSSSLNVQTNLLTPFGKTEPSGFAISSDSDGAYEDWVCNAKMNGKEIDLKAFKLVITKATYNTQPVQELDNIINQRKGQNMTSGSAGASNISAQNPLSTTPVTTTRATTQYTQRQAYEQTQEAKTAKEELTAQIVTQAGSLAGNLLDEWNAASERKAQRRDAERSAAIKASVKEERQKRSDKFEFVYLPLMDLAKKGDENARMILYFSSWRLKQEYLVPLRERWLEEAVANKNIDALLMKALAALDAYKKGDENVITDMEKIAGMGSEDAMVKLAMWYSHKTNIDGISGGGNEKKALEWFNKAAGAGSPNAMYFLGMIYKYRQVVSDKYEQKLFIKFTVAKNEKLALDWFIKAEQPDYKESIYSRFQSSRAPFLANTSYYIPCRYETYLLYKKGKTVRDKAKAEEMEKEMEAGNSQYRIDYENYKKTNEQFGNTDRY